MCPYHVFPADQGWHPEDIQNCFDFSFFGPYAWIVRWYGKLITTGERQLVAVTADLQSFSRVTGKLL